MKSKTKKMKARSQAHSQRLEYKLHPNLKLSHLSEKRLKKELLKSVSQNNDRRATGGQKRTTKSRRVHTRFLTKGSDLSETPHRFSPYQLPYRVP